MCLQFVGRIGVHPLDDLLPFSVVPGQTIILVDDQENPSARENSPHSGEALLDVRPEVDGLEGGHKGELRVTERERCHIGPPDLTTSLSDGISIDFGGFCNGDGRIVDAGHFRRLASGQQPGDVGASAAADVQDFPSLGDVDYFQSPLGHGGVGTAVHPGDHQPAEEPFRLSGVAEYLAEESH